MISSNHSNLFIEYFFSVYIIYYINLYMYNVHALLLNSSVENVCQWISNKIMIDFIFYFAFFIFTSAAMAASISYGTEVPKRHSSTIAHVIPIVIESIVNNRIWFSPVTLQSMTNTKKESGMSTCKFNNRKTIFSDQGQDSTTYKMMTTI